MKKNPVTDLVELLEKSWAREANLNRKVRVLCCVSLVQMTMMLAYGIWKCWR